MVQSLVLFRAISQSNLGFFEDLYETHGGSNLDMIIQQADAMLVAAGYVNSIKLWDFVHCDDNEELYSKMESEAIYNSVVTVIIQCFNFYDFSKKNPEKNFEDVYGICAGIVSAYVISISENTDDILSKIKIGIQIVIEQNKLMAATTYDKPCLMNIQKGTKADIKDIIEKLDLKDICFAIEYSNETFLLSGRPESLVQLKKNISNKCNFLSVKYPVHNSVLNSQYKMVDFEGIEKKMRFRLLTHSKKDGIDLENIASSLTNYQTFETNNVRNFFESYCDDLTEIYDFGCGGKNGVVEILRQSCEGLNCRLYNYDYGMDKNLF